MAAASFSSRRQLTQPTRGDLLRQWPSTNNSGDSRIYNIYKIIYSSITEKNSKCRIQIIDLCDRPVFFRLTTLLLPDAKKNADRGLHFSDSPQLS